MCSIVIGRARSEHCNTFLKGRKIVLSPVRRQSLVIDRRGGISGHKRKHCEQFYHV